MNCNCCHKDLPKGSRYKIYGAPKLARFCFNCRKNWWAGFWKLSDIFVFKKGGWNLKLI